MRILIGTGTTDANGQVTVNYTGSGAGKVQLMAECGDIQSEPYTLYDVSFKDIGTEDDYTAWSYTSNITIERTDYTSITPSASYSYQSLVIDDTMSVFEFDLNLTFSTGGSGIFAFRKGTTSVQDSSITINEMGLTSGEWSHVKYVRDGTTVSCYVDNVLKDTCSLTDTPNRFYMILNNTNHTLLKYKNFIIYPI